MQIMLEILNSMRHSHTSSSWRRYLHCSSEADGRIRQVTLTRRLNLDPPNARKQKFLVACSENCSSLPTFFSPHPSHSNPHTLVILMWLCFSTFPHDAVASDPLQQAGESGADMSVYQEKVCHLLQETTERILWSEVSGCHICMEL